MPIIAHQNQIIGQATNAEALVKDTVGWTGKNKLKTGAGTSGSIGNGTWKINSDGSITINTTLSSLAIAPWRLATGGMDPSEVLGGSDIPKGTYRIVWLNANGQKNDNIRLQIFGTNGALNTGTEIANTHTAETVTIDDTYAYYYARVWLNTGTINDTIYGMLVSVDITDPTYEPYHESVEVMYEEEIHGANLFPLIGNRGDKSVDGVECKAVGDGSYTIIGTKTTNNISFFPLHLYKANTLPEKIIYKVFSSNYTNVRGLIRSDPQTSPIDDVRDTNGKGATFIPKKDTDVLVFVAVHGNAGTSINATVKPMIRKADIEDSTYRPYNPQAIQNQLNAQGVLGAKNLLPFDPISETINGVTFTVNADGSVTAIGTPTDIIRYTFTRAISNDRIAIPSDLIGKNVIISAGFTEDNGTLELSCITKTSSATDISDHIISNGQTERQFTIESNAVYIRIYVIFDRNGNHTPVNLTMKPMLRLASDPDDTYQPYAMTNRELTEEVSNITNTLFTNVTAQPNTITSLGSFTLSKGKYIVTAIVSMSKQATDFDISISFSTGPSSFGASRFDSFNGKAPLAASGGIQATKMFNVSSDTRVYIVANHNHSSELALYPAVSIAKV